MSTQEAFGAMRRVFTASFGGNVKGAKRKKRKNERKNEFETKLKYGATNQTPNARHEIANDDSPQCQSARTLATSTTHLQTHTHTYTNTPTHLHKRQSFNDRAECCVATNQKTNNNANFTGWL